MTKLNFSSTQQWNAQAWGCYHLILACFRIKKIEYVEETGLFDDQNHSIPFLWTSPFADASFALEINTTGRLLPMSIAVFERNRSGEAAED